MPREGDLVVGDPITMTYRCSGNPASANPTAVVLDETGGVFETLTVGSGIEYTGHGKTFSCTFTPDAIGTWIINITDANGGDASKSFPVNTYGLGYVVDQMTTITQDMASLAIILGGLQQEASENSGGASIG